MVGCDLQYIAYYLELRRDPSNIPTWLWHVDQDILDGAIHCQLESPDCMRTLWYYATGKLWT